MRTNMETLTFLMPTTFYPPYHIGGDAIHVQCLAEELVKIGHEVHVIHSIDAYNIKNKNLRRIKESNGVIVHPIKTLFNSSAYSTYFFGRSSKIMNVYERILQEIKPDVVHHHNISLLGYTLLKKIGSYHELYTAHDYWLICQKNTLLTDEFNVCKKRECMGCAIKSRRVPQIWRHGRNFSNVIRDIDNLIAPSYYMANQLKNLEIKSSVIANFAPEISFTKEIMGKKYIAFVGVLETHKGILNLISAFEKIARKVEYDFIIAGEGRLKSQIQETLKQSGLQSRVKLLGWVDHDSLYSILYGAKAVVIPSLCQENCPMVAIEALSVGTPVIGSNNGGLPEIIGKLDSSLIYSHPNKLVDILLDIENRNYRKADVKAVYQRHFSPKAYLTAYLSLLNKMHN